MNGRVFDVQRFCLHDGPGIRTTVFLKGCTLRCLWCHNPEGLEARVTVGFRGGKCVGCGRCLSLCALHTREGGAHRVAFECCTGCGRCVAACPAQALFLTGREMTPEETAALAERDKAFYRDGGGVTFSGGEPLTQAEFVAEAAALCRARGLSVAVDTCGNVPFEAFEQVLPMTDLFLYDLKAFSPDTHAAYTGCGNALIHANLRRLDALGARLWLRVPLIHGVNDTPAELEGLAGLAASLRHAERVTLIPYHDLGVSKYAEIGMTPRMNERFHLPDEALARAREVFTAAVGARLTD